MCLPAMAEPEVVVPCRVPAPTTDTPDIAVRIMLGPEALNNSVTLWSHAATTTPLTMTAPGQNALNSQDTLIANASNYPVHVLTAVGSKMADGSIPYSVQTATIGPGSILRVPIAREEHTAVRIVASTVNFWPANPNDARAIIVSGQGGSAVQWGDSFNPRQYYRSAVPRSGVTALLEGYDPSNMGRVLPDDFQYAVNTGARLGLQEENPGAAPDNKVFVNCELDGEGNLSPGADCGVANARLSLSKTTALTPAGTTRTVVVVDVQPAAVCVACTKASDAGKPTECAACGTGGTPCAPRCQREVDLDTGDAKARTANVSVLRAMAKSMTPPCVPAGPGPTLPWDASRTFILRWNVTGASGAAFPPTLALRSADVAALADGATIDTGMTGVAITVVRPAGSKVVTLSVPGIPASSVASFTPDKYVQNVCRVSGFDDCQGIYTAPRAASCIGMFSANFGGQCKSVCMQQPPDAASETACRTLVEDYCSDPVRALEPACACVRRDISPATVALTKDGAKWDPTWAEFRQWYKTTTGTDPEDERNTGAPVRCWWPWCVGGNGGLYVPQAGDNASDKCPDVLNVCLTSVKNVTKDDNSTVDIDVKCSGNSPSPGPDPDVPPADNTKHAVPPPPPVLPLSPALKSDVNFTIVLVVVFLIVAALLAYGIYAIFQKKRKA